MRITTVLFLLLLTCHRADAQVPAKMSYQAVIRKASNALVVNAPVKMRISILQGSVTGTAVYTELHNPTTNANGLVSLEIGAGTSPSGSIANIDWSNGPFYLRTEIDPSNETNYSVTTTTQLLSVPYSLFSNTANVARVSDTAFILKSDKFSNTAAGSAAQLVSGSGSVVGNVAIGDSALKYNLASFNTAIGSRSLNRNTFGAFNVGLGAFSLRSNTSGSFNFSVGNNALASNTTGSNNIAIGANALSSNTTGGLNIAIGFNALKNSIGPGPNAEGNVAIGFKSMENALSTRGNTALGYSSMNSLTIGNDNTGLGENVLSNAKEAYNNVVIGSAAMIGASDKASNNVVIGVRAGSSISGNGNTFIGYEAGIANKGSGNIFLGNGAGYDVAFSNVSNKFIVDNNAASTNPLLYGDFNTKTIKFNGDIYLPAANVGVILTSPNGKCWKLTVSNDGSLVTTAVPCPIL